MDIKTPRLILRKFEMRDAEALFKLDTDPEVMRYLPFPTVKSIAEEEAVIRRIHSEYINHGTARLIIEERETGAFVGWAGLKFITETTNGISNFYDVGYRLVKKHWGKGYGTESAIASIQFGFEELNAKEIYAMAHAENAASNKILTKIGMQRLGTFLYAEIPHHFYKITKL